MNTHIHPDDIKEALKEIRQFIGDRLEKLNAINMGVAFEDVISEAEFRWARYDTDNTIPTEYRTASGESDESMKRWHNSRVA